MLHQFSLRQFKQNTLIFSYCICCFLHTNLTSYCCTSFVFKCMVCNALDIKDVEVLKCLFYLFPVFFRSKGMSKENCIPRPFDPHLWQSLTRYGNEKIVSVILLWFPEIIQYCCYKLHELLFLYHTY